MSKKIEELKTLVSELNRESLDYPVPEQHEMIDREAIIFAMAEALEEKSTKRMKKERVIHLMKIMRNSCVFYPDEMIDVMEKIEEELEEW